MQVTEKALTDWITGEGFMVVEFDGELWGYTNREARLVAVNRRLATFQRVPTLLHEAIHVRENHDGHQGIEVEAAVNREVAGLLVDPAEYMFWESQYGWATGGIAAALELPRWVVSAYRECLREGGASCG